MKTYPKFLPYTTAARNVAFPEKMDVVVNFKGARCFMGCISELPAWIKENEPGPFISCFSTADKRRYGIYFVLKASNEQVAAVLSKTAGAPVAVGEGATFATRYSVVQRYKLMKDAGLPVTGADLCIGITADPLEDYKAAQEAQPQGKEPQPAGESSYTEAQAAAALADAPPF